MRHKVRYRKSANNVARLPILFKYSRVAVNAYTVQGVLQTVNRIQKLKKLPRPNNRAVRI
jgi:hypothetical protein